MRFWAGTTFEVTCRNAWLLIEQDVLNLHGSLTCPPRASVWVGSTPPSQSVDLPSQCLPKQSGVTVWLMMDNTPPGGARGWFGLRLSYPA